MANLTHEEINRIRTSVNIVDVIGSNITLQKNRTSQGEVPSIIYFSSESLRQKPRMRPAMIVPMATARM